MAELSVGIEAAYGLIEAMTALADAAEDWPQEKRDKFMAEWESLMRNGCDLVDMTTTDDTITANVSQDLLQHFAAYGIVV